MRPIVHSHADPRRHLAIASHRRHPERPAAGRWRAGARGDDGPSPVGPNIGQQLVACDAREWPASMNAAATLEPTFRHGARELHERPREVGTIDAPQSPGPEGERAGAER